MSDFSRDLNKWNVSIPLVETRKDPNLGILKSFKLICLGKTYYVYLIQVEGEPNQRFDEEDLFINKMSDSDKMHTFELPTVWTVAHRYEEFYNLEAQIQDLEQDTIIKLPDKNAFTTLKTRAFLMEAHRAVFEKFLKNLASNVAFKRSELLYSFLTCSEEDEVEENLQNEIELDLNEKNNLSESGLSGIFKIFILNFKDFLGEQCVMCLTN